jgi:hypothetical protein
MSTRAVICSRGARARARCLRVALTAALSAIALPARAEDPVPDPVAQALFQDGRDLVDKGSWDAGCTKFEASMLLYPAASTLLNIASCHEHKQKLASAWSAYKRVLVLNRETIGDDRRRSIDELATQEIAKLTPRLPKIKLSMKRQVLGVTLRKDGELVPDAVIGTEMPVDGGEHEIAADAPGHRPFRIRLEVKESTLREVVIDLVPEGQADARDGAERPPRWAWATAGAGVLFMGMSAGLRIDQAFIEGLQAGKCGGDVLKGCPPRSQYDPGPDNTRKNVDFALFVGFGAAGVAALAASIYGLLRGSSPSPPPAAALVVTREGAIATFAYQF